MTNRKKLYKAKKHWIICLIVGIAVMAMGEDTIHADNGNYNNAVTTTRQVYASAQSDTIGMSSQVATNQSGSYNQQGVGYISPNAEKMVYDNQQQHHLKYPNEYTYRPKLENQFAKQNTIIDSYDSPIYVYQYLGSSSNPYAQVTAKPIVGENGISSVDQDKVHYLNNGVSNAIQFNNTQGEVNYEAIDFLSQALSYSDYRMLKDAYSHPGYDKNMGKFYDGNTAIVNPSKNLSTQDLDAIYKAAYKNKPMITFDKTVKDSHITSLLQANLIPNDDSWKYGFDNGWHGYTLQDGKQIRFDHIIRPNSKDFSWKNIILKYIVQTLKYKKSFVEDNGGDRAPSLLIGPNYLPITDLIHAKSLSNPFCVSPTQVIFAQDGVYAIINGAMAGYDPILVKIPMRFLKPKYQAFYDTNLPALSKIIVQFIDKISGKVVSQAVFEQMDLK